MSHPSKEVPKMKPLDLDSFLKGRTLDVVEKQDDAAQRLQAKIRALRYGHSDNNGPS